MKRQRSPERLNICVALEQTSPPAWWHSLLSGIESHPDLNLTRILICTTDSPTPDNGAGAQNAASLTDRLGDVIVQCIVDRPRQQHDPLERSTIESCFQDRIEHLDSSQNTSGDSLNAALAHQHVDVLIQSPEVILGLDSSTPLRVWMPDLKTVHARAKRALTKRSPFFYIKLLQRLLIDEDQKPPAPEWATLANHTLPLQTFSITDLEIAAHACLPGLFMAQLSWLTMGHAECPVVAPESGPALASIAVAPVSTSNQSAHDKHSTELSALSRLRGPVNLLWQQFSHRLRDQLYYEQWQLGLLAEHDISESIDELIRTSVESYLPLPPPDGHSWADPHLTEQDGAPHVFFEAIEAKGNRGWINSASLGEGDFRQTLTRSLSTDHHLSYPFTFKHDDQHWMIPETSSEGMVSLYRCTSFPDQWERVGTLMSGVNVADCTVLHREGRWWLFGNTMTHPSVDERDELRIWHADQLSGPWQAHPLNPVLTGVHHSRMAGGFLHSGGQLFRPSQYGAWRYGHAINIARVDRLTLEDYHETIVGQIKPDSGSPWLGCHSISHLNGMTLIDRVQRRNRVAQWMRTRMQRAFGMHASM